jgi:hypothetical protein
MAVIFLMLPEMGKMSKLSNQNSLWKVLYKVGGAAAIGAVLVGIVEILITFLPGGSAAQETVIDWFNLYQENWFMGLRNMGLLNLILNSLAILTYTAIYGAHRRNRYQSIAGLAAVIAFIGIAVFFATNRAFSMLELSRLYTAATSEQYRMTLEAAGNALLVVGASHTPGTFAGFALTEMAGILISFVMLKSDVFSKTTAILGLIGFSVLLIFEFTSSFIAGLDSATMLLAAFGGILTMGWYILVAKRFFQLEDVPVE